MGGWIRHLALVLALLTPGFSTSPASAQEFGRIVSPILVLDQEKLFRDSSFGKSISAALNDERSRQEAATRRIEAELVAEELALTDARESLTAEEFREMADAFDIKVQGLRKESIATQAQLVAKFEQSKVQFLEKVTPILSQIMRESNAVVLLEKRTVLLTNNQVDITDLAIAQVDAAFDADNLDMESSNPGEDGD